MNIIANSCCGGHLYKSLFKQPFQNPFIWNIIDFNSMLYLIKNYDKINFNNYELIKDNKWNFKIIIDNHIIIQYVHYKFNEKCNKPIRKGMDVFYNKIWEYIVEKYEDRKNRMIRNKESPIFILADWWDRPDTQLTYNRLKLLNDLNQNNIICGVDKIHPEFKNIKQFIRKTKIVHNDGIAIEIFNQFFNK